MAIPREHPLSGGHRRDYTRAPQVTKAYLLGILHDATARKTTYRIATKDFSFCQYLTKGIKTLGPSAWFYKSELLAILHKSKIASRFCQNYWFGSPRESFLLADEDIVHVPMKIGR